MKKLLVSAVALAMLAGCSSGGAASTANTSGGTAGKSVTIATDTDILSMNSSTSTDGTSFIEYSTPPEPLCPVLRATHSVERAIFLFR